MYLSQVGRGGPSVRPLFCGLKGDAVRFAVCVSLAPYDVRTVSLTDSDAGDCVVVFLR